MSESPNLDAALTYARRGWSVFPCYEPGPRGCACGSPSCASPAKHPRIARGLHAASADPEEIRRWWTRWPGANVGVRTGADSGLVVVDVDPRHGGSASLRALLAERGPLPDGPVVATGGGGVHVYFAHPGHRVSNDAGRRLGAGLDVRGDGGYVLAPPSMHANGGTYRWLEWRAAVPDLPRWLGRLLERPVIRRQPDPVRPVGARPWADAEGWASAALSAEAAEVAAAPEGTRNTSLNRAAFRIGQIVGGAGLERTVAESALLHAALSAGLDEVEARRTLKSGLDAGLDSPRRPRPGRSRGTTERSGAEIGHP